jgi:hypothetical protein
MQSVTIGLDPAKNVFQERGVVVFGRRPAERRSAFSSLS